ncbi:hypothetical protein GCM10020255_087990 [Rhodococcus baikonurensis]
MWNAGATWFEHEHRNLTIGLRLIVGVVGVRSDSALPPDRLLVAGDFTSNQVEDLRRVTQGDVRIGLDVVIPDRILRAPPSEATTAYEPSCSTRISGVFLTLPDFAPIVVRTTTGMPFMSFPGATGILDACDLIGGPRRWTGFVLTCDWHVYQ